MKKKILSLLTAFAMVFGILVAPFTTASADNGNEPVEVPTGVVKTSQVSLTEPKSTTLNLYKLMADSFKDGAPWNHTGGVIDPTTGYPNLGKNVKGLKGVEFTYYEVTDAQLATMKANPNSYKTAADVEAFLKNGNANAQITKKTVTTGEGGLSTINVEGKKALWFIETGYTKQDKNAPDSISSYIAVPFGITLPLTNAYDIKEDNSETVKYKAGTVYLKEVNVYPKNLVTNKVEIDKNFLKGKAGKMTEAELNEFIAEAQREGKLNVSDDMVKAWKADIAKYNTDKDTVSTKVGTKIPYEVVTNIPQNNTYKSMSWSDIMTKGLKYNNDLKITVEQAKIGDQEATTVTYDFSTNTTPAGATYNKTDYGFDVTFNENTETSEQAIMKDIEAKVKKGAVVVRLQYSATVTNETVVDKPEDNKITFTPGKPDPGKDLKPSDGKITVTKSWAGKDGKTADAPTGVEVTYYLIADGKVVETVKKSSPNFDHTFEKLDNNKTYTVKEVVKGYKPAYESKANGAVTVTNKLDPEVLVPKTPKVVTGGKKFVKADERNGKRLQGAKFEVYDKEKDGKVLAYLKPNEKDAKQTAVDTAKAELDKLIAEYNAMSAEEQKGQAGQAKKEAIKTAQKTYDDAVEANNGEYKWVETTDTSATRVVLESDTQGKFEIKGLSYGTYYLKETQAPKDYALNENRFKFEVKKDSYTSGQDGVTYKSDEAVSETTKGEALKLNNRNLTIPQTGGIGSLIFIVAGLAIMTGAFIAYKKSQAVEA